MLWCVVCCVVLSVDFWNTILCLADGDALDAIVHLPVFRVLLSFLLARVSALSNVQTTWLMTQFLASKALRNLLVTPEYARFRTVHLSRTIAVGPCNLLALHRLPLMVCAFVR